MFHLTELWSLCGLFLCGWFLSFSVEPTERINSTEQPVVTEHTLSCVQASGYHLRMTENLHRPSEAVYPLFSNHPSVLKCHLHHPRHPQTHGEYREGQVAACQRPFRSLLWKRVKSKEPPTGPSVPNTIKVLSVWLRENGGDLCCYWQEAGLCDRSLSP